MNNEFYDKVLPSRGVYCAAAIDNAKKVTHRFADTLVGLGEAIGGFSKAELNVYFSPLTFSAWSRTAKTAEWVKSFFIDLDVNHGDPCYPSKDEALMALQDFLHRTGLPPPVTLCSGSGIQAYWVFDEDIPARQWLPYARKFKDYCIANGLLIDPAVTADSARIMRAPNTTNYRTGQPLPTYVIDEEIFLYSFDAFKEFLGPINDLENILSQAEKGLDDDSKAVIYRSDNFQTMFSKIAVRSLEGDGCNQIRYILENSSTLSQPLWHSGLSIARHCTDWEDAIQLMSEDHPGYTPEATRKKADETLNKPHGCYVFADRNPGGCEGCSHRGHITNPLALGREVAPAAPAAPDPSGAAAGVPSPEWPPDPHLMGFTLGQKGGVIFQPPPDIDKDGKKHYLDPVEITAWDVYPVKRVYSPVEGYGECLLVRCVLPNDPLREALLPMKQALARDELLKFLSTIGASPDPVYAPYLVRYMKKWSDYLVMKDSAEQLRMQMGWSDSNDAFVIGSVEILATGEMRPTAPSPMVKNVAKLLEPYGDRSAWERAVAKLDGPGYELHGFGLLCGFGSPLMRFMDTPGMTFCFTNPDSGTGKSGALFAALSVWGRPKELSVMESSSTDNAFIGRMVNLKNMPFAIDEVTTAKIEDLPKLIHRISQGRPKMRMQASVNAERDLEMPASLIALFSSNRNIYDALQIVKGSPDGEMARLLQFNLRKPPGMTNEVGSSIFGVMRDNYGFAGPDYVRYLFRVGDEHIRATVSRWDHRFVERMGNDSAHRFYRSGIVAAMAGGELATECGLIDLDLDKIFLAVIAETIKVSTGTAKLNATDYKSLYGEFIHEYWPGVLIVDDGRVIVEPRMSVIGRVELDSGKQFIARGFLKKWLTQRQISVDAFETELEKDHILVRKDGKQRLTSGWKTGGVTPPIAVYEMRYQLSDDLISGLKGT